MVFSKFKVKISTELDQYHLKAWAWGEEFSTDIHEIRDEVKAITYHLMEIKKNSVYRLQFIVDV
jgi:SHS2 domain-containing protein